MFHRSVSLHLKTRPFPWRPLLRRYCMNDKFAFGPYTIQASEVFATSKLSYAFVNLRPIVPGHVLVSTKRVVHRFGDLTGEEVTDLWQLAQEVGKKVEKHFGGDSLTLCIQDGPSAGQTVPHVHVHCVPRRGKDFESDNAFYDRLEETPTERVPLSLDRERKDRTLEDMSREAAELRSLFD